MYDRNMNGELTPPKRNLEEEDGEDFIEVLKSNITDKVLAKIS